MILLFKGLKNRLKSTKLFKRCISSFCVPSRYHHLEFSEHSRCFCDHSIYYINLSRCSEMYFYQFLYQILTIIIARKRQFEESVRQKPIIERNVHSKEIVARVPIPKPRMPRKEVREEEQAAKRNQFGNNRVRYMHNIQL
jgi:hypothetical protein